MGLLTVSNLQKSFGKTLVLDGVSFEIKQGECIALLGPSGCGKSTTLRCIAGLESPDDGRVELGGKLLNDGAHVVPPQERNMGLVFQSYSVWPHLTVFDNVAFGMKLRRVKSGEIRERVTRILEMMKLGHLADRRSWQLSGGQLQRVAVARTLVVEPKLVLFDEPLSNLDAKLRLYMRVEIRSLLKRLGLSAVYVTHDQSEASVVADKVAVMNEGRIEQIGSWNDLYYEPASQFVAGFMGAGNVMDGTILAVNEDGVRVRLGEALADVTIVSQKAFAATPGKQIRVYVPPEAISLCSVGAGACSARIESVLPGPGVCELEIDFGGKVKLSAVKLSTDDRPQAGVECGVRFDSRYLRVLEEVSGP